MADTLYEQEQAARVANAFNRMGFNNEAFAEYLCHNEHRTLQQNVMRAFAACIAQWAKDGDANQYDARNEDTVRVSQAIVKQFGPLFFRHI